MSDISIGVDWSGYSQYVNTNSTCIYELKLNRNVLNLNQENDQYIKRQLINYVYCNYFLCQYEYQ